MCTRCLLAAEGGGRLAHLVRGSGWKIQTEDVSGQETAEVLPSGGGPFHRPALVVTLILWSHAVNEEPVFGDEVEA